MNLIFTNDFCLEQKYLRDKYVTKLENAIIKYNEALKEGIMYVDDATYTNCIELLTMLNPSSPLLENSKNVKFIKAVDEEVIEYLEGKLDDPDKLEFYLNPQGVNVKLTYECGELTSAVTFGRTLREENVLEAVKAILTNRNDQLVDYGLVTVWGVFVLPTDNMESASELCRVDNEYQGVFSLINYAKEYQKERDSLELSDEFQDYASLKDIVEDINFEDIMYFIATDVDLEDFPFETIQQKYDFLADWGFETPELCEIGRSDTLSMDLDMIQGIVENDRLNYPYLTDGYRLLVFNDKDIILFKTGFWEINYFESVVEDIIWRDEKGKKLPVLILQDEIEIYENNIDTKALNVSEIMLSNVNLLLMLDIEIGKTVRFANFGEMGILPITKNNEIILN